MTLKFSAVHLTFLSVYRIASLKGSSLTDFSILETKVEIFLLEFNFLLKRKKNENILKLKIKLKKQKLK